MSKTHSKPKYYYSPRFNHFNIYRRDSEDSDTMIDSVGTQEEAKRKVYKLNGWDYNPKNKIR